RIQRLQPRSEPRRPRQGTAAEYLRTSSTRHRRIATTKTPRGEALPFSPNQRSRRHVSWVRGLPTDLRHRGQTAPANLTRHILRLGVVSPPGRRTPSLFGQTPAIDRSARRTRLPRRLRSRNSYRLQSQ